MKKVNWTSTFAERWLKYWTAPARPTKNRLIFIRKTLKKKIRKVGKKDFKLLILGSTSEFRDMMIELGVRPTVVDFNEANYHVLAKKMKHYKKYPKNEDYVQSDWLGMDTGKKYDVILGDACFNVLGLKDSDSFLKNVTKHLKDDGIYIDTIWSQRPKDKNFDIRKLLKKKAKILKEFSLYETFSGSIYLTVYDYKKNYGQIDKIPSIIKNLYSEGLISKKQLDDFLKLGMEQTKFRFFMPFRTWLDNRLKKHFVIQKMWRETDRRYAWQYFATFVLKKK